MFYCSMELTIIWTQSANCASTIRYNLKSMNQQKCKHDRLCDICTVIIQFTKAMPSLQILAIQPFYTISQQE